MSDLGRVSYRGRMLILSSFGTIVAYTGQLALSPLLPTIVDEYSITTADAGLALTVMWGVGAISQFPGGRLADEWTPKTVMIAGLGSLLFGYSLILNGDTYGVFVLGMVLVGTGTGVYQPAALRLLSVLFDEDRGVAFGTLSAAINVGGVTASVLVTVALNGTPWKFVFLWTIGALSVAVVVLHRWNRESYRIGLPSLDIGSTGARLLLNPEVRGVLLTLSLFGFVWQGFVNFLPMFLRTQKGFPPPVANVSFAGLFAVGIFATPLVGWVGDRTGHLQLVIGAPVLGTVGLLTILLASERLTIILGLGLVTIGLTAIWPLLQVHLTRILANTDVGGDFGATRTVYFGVGSLGPLYVGVVSDATSLAMAFSGFVLCFLLSIGYLVTLVRRE